MKNDIVMATCIVNILIFALLLWLLYVPGAQTTGWELFIWVLAWLPAAIFGTIAIINGFAAVRKGRAVGGVKTAILALSWLTIITNLVVIGLIAWVVTR